MRNYYTRDSAMKAYQLTHWTSTSVGQLDQTWILTLDVDVVIGMESVQLIVDVFVWAVKCLEIEMLWRDKTDGRKIVQSSMFILKTKEKWLARTLEWEY